MNTSSSVTQFNPDVTAAMQISRHNKNSNSKGMRSSDGVPVGMLGAAVLTLLGSKESCPERPEPAGKFKQPVRTLAEQ